MGGIWGICHGSFKDHSLSTPGWKNLPSEVWSLLWRALLEKAPITRAPRTSSSTPTHSALTSTTRRERERDTYIYIYIYTYTHVYMYTYICPYIPIGSAYKYLYVYINTHTDMHTSRNIRAPNLDSRLQEGSQNCRPSMDRYFLALLFSTPSYEESIKAY